MSSTTGPVPSDQPSGLYGKLAASVLSADHLHLADDVSRIEPHAGALHVDFMDGHFVPTLGLAPAV